MYLWETLSHILLFKSGKIVCKFSRNEQNYRILKSLVENWNKKNLYKWGE